MDESITIVAAWCAVFVEVIGIAVISLSAVYALYRGASGKLNREDNDSILQSIRQSMGQGMLLGLEFLIAADIIYTVAVELTIENIGVLALVVLIRTFLSFTLEVEVSGRWPWQNHRNDRTDSGSAGSQS